MKFHFRCAVLVWFIFQRNVLTGNVTAVHDTDKNSYLKILAGKTLVIVGDSISRYQYLNLVYYIEHAMWPPRVLGDNKFELHGSVCNEKEVGWNNSFNDFFKGTNRGLRGNEVCDCYRTPGWVIENRYYFRPGVNITIIFLWWAALPMHYRKNMTLLRPLPQLCKLGPSNDSVSGSDVASTPTSQNIQLPFCDKEGVASHMQNYFRVGKLIQAAVKDYGPHAIVINSGKHRMYRWDESPGKEQYLSIVEAVRELRAAGSDVKFIWKSTTPSVNYALIRGGGDVSTALQKSILFLEPKSSNLMATKLVQSGLFELFDANGIVLRLWDQEYAKQRTYDARNTSGRSFRQYSLYWDSNHFYCWVYEELNKAMIMHVLK